MAKKKLKHKDTKRKNGADDKRIIPRTGEALVAAEPEVIMGELDGQLE